jgi:hypothetical protein
VKRSVVKKEEELEYKERKKKSGKESGKDDLGVGGIFV